MAGYGPYLESVSDLTDGKDLIASGMTREIERCRLALDQAVRGSVVSLLSSGDAGVYGMAGLAIEMAVAEGLKVPIEVVAGISAANAAAARLGAPLMLDYACISLSDLLVPWETVVRRLTAVAEADLVTALYNPKSAKRVNQIHHAASIFRRCRPGTTPVGIATAAGSAEERIVVSDLDHFLEEEIGMRSVVLIGNNSSKCLNGWFITPRGYKI